jgi:lysophospholipase L1-like esterase
MARSGPDFAARALALKPRHQRGPRVAIFGTSITDQASRWVVPPAATPASAWYSDGYATWLRQVSLGAVDIPLSCSFGVSGNKFSDMLARIDAAIVVMKANNVRYCIVEGGSNDIGNDVPFNTFAPQWLTLCLKLQDAGIKPVTTPIIPRAGSVLTAAQLKRQQRFNAYVAKSAYDYDFGFVNWNKWLLDQTSNLSIPLTGYVKSDNLHPAGLAAIPMGLALWDDFFSKELPALEPHVFGAADIYDPVENPTGNLLYSGSTNYGMLAGTGGTQTASTNLTYVGSSAAGSTLIRSNSTNTATVTASKVTRTDRGSGEGQRLQYALNSGGSADEIHNLRFTPALSDINVGDWIYSSCLVEIKAAPVNVNAFENILVETRPSNSQTSGDGLFNSSLAGQLSPLLNGRKLLLRGPAIQRQSDSTAFQWNFRTRFKTDVGAASADVAVYDPAVRKLF